MGGRVEGTRWPFTFVRCRPPGSMDLPKGSKRCKKYVVSASTIDSGIEVGKQTWKPEGAALAAYLFIGTSRKGRF